MTTAPATTAAPDALDSLGSWRLRPGVTASALAQGLHVRGWSSAVSMEGSPALPALWRMVEEALRADGAADLAARAPAGTPLRAALCTLIGQLHTQGMLVGASTAPADGPAAEWLATVAARPAEAAAALAATRVEVRTADRDDPLAPAALRALARAGVTATLAGSREPAGSGVLLTAARPDGTELAVAALARPGGAFVTPVGSPAGAGADAAALRARLGRDGLDGPRAAEAPSGPALTALVAGGAVQRLLCAVAGLPDPDSEDTAEEAGAGASPRLRTALVAAEDPPHAAYHPWLGGPPAPQPPPGTLAEALAGVEALGDEHLGPLPAPGTGSLPQLPVALVECAAPGGGRLTAGGARADLARLDALCRAAELRLGAGRSGVVVGAGPGHALGRALRRAALARPLPVGAAAPWNPYGAGHAQARHWWTALTGRLGVRAELTLTPLDTAEAAFRAEVRGGRDGRLLGQAVEATAGDAAAFATLAALARVQAGTPDPTDRHFTSAGGELCALAVAGIAAAPWEDENWSAGWWARVAGREAALQDSLRRLTGLSARPWAPDGPDTRAVLTALRACGFTALETGAPATDAPDTEGESR
ncbi:hypothetical protein OOK31_01645 [Streptomyces sp. NBC_00249]|uniref:hypothetical protein n=1 Tax=Streptomyces sp. NBC_00249 TaxID=2975690 RepID=UPI0022507A0F|nr:hypothetical protein [Streptomyces sp. NBC_00249]MCX5192604.1 hypothetical protein [Streptomyces sp. NBC_00249]